MWSWMDSAFAFGSAFPSPPLFIFLAHSKKLNSSDPDPEPCSEEVFASSEEEEVFAFGFSFAPSNILYIC